MKTKILSILIISLSILNSGCLKPGCTDGDATNFNSKAKKDDGTCHYEGKVVFWNNLYTSTSLLNDGAVSLTYYVDGQVVGSSAASVYWTGTPDCGQSVSITKDLGSVKNKSYSYSVKDQTGFEYWYGVLNFTANTCSGQELAW